MLSRRVAASPRLLFRLFLCPFLACAAGPARAQVVKHPNKERPPVVLPPSTSNPGTTPPPENKAYDPQLMHLAEILGALTYLRELCGDTDSADWRQRMQALLDAEGTPAVRKDRLAGAFNQGLQGYELSYRTCTANARLVIQRFLVEGGRIAQDIENRYRAS